MQCVFVFLIVFVVASFVCMIIRSIFISKDNRYRIKNRSVENALYLAFEREKSKQGS